LDVVDKLDKVLGNPMRLGAKKGTGVFVYAGGGIAIDARIRCRITLLAPVSVFFHGA
jgi:hypothetical protein